MANFSRMKRLQIIALILIFFAQQTKGQQEQSFSHFMFQQAVYNPAASGNQESIQLNGLIRQQWIGLNGAPETYFVNIHSPLELLHGGIGATILNDKIGPFSSVGLKLAYAYKTSLWQGDFSTGLSVGLINESIDYGYFNVQDDPFLTSTAVESGMIFNVDAGAYYQEKDRLYIGLASTQLNQGKMIVAAGQTSLKRNIYLQGGYFFKLRQIPQVVFHPSAMLVYTSKAPLQLNIGFLGEYNKKFWAGVTYKNQSAIGLMTGLNFRQIAIGYVYEINTTELKNGGSHELMIGYKFLIEIEKGKKTYKNTRYL